FRQIFRRALWENIVVIIRKGDGIILLFFRLDFHHCLGGRFLLRRLCGSFCLHIFFFDLLCILAFCNHLFFVLRFFLWLLCCFHCCKKCRCHHAAGDDCQQNIRELPILFIKVKMLYIFLLQRLHIEIILCCLKQGTAIIAIFC